MEDAPCDALRKWSYDESARTWTKPGAEPLREDKLDGLELKLAQRWNDIVDEANQKAAL